MSKVYGPIKWSTVGSPNPLTGICENFNYRIGDQLFKVPGEAGFAAAVRHGKKGELSFSSTPPGTVATLPIRAGAELAVAGIAAGKIINSRVSANWRRGTPLKFDASANHYPALAGEAVGELAVAEFVFARTAKALQLPLDKVWWGAESVPKLGLTGIVESFSIEESVQFPDETEDDDQEGAPIVGVVVDNYESTARLEILTAEAVLPEEGSTMPVFGAFRVNGVEKGERIGNKRLVTINGYLIPGVTDAEEEGGGEGED